MRSWLKVWLESPDKSNLFCLNAAKLVCGNDGGEITRLCDSDISWLLLNWRD